MPKQNRLVRPGRLEGSVVTETGEQLTIPEGWSLLPPGDGALTKLVKAKGPTWLVQVQYRNRLISKGIWAGNEQILAAGKELAVKRAAPGYARKKEQALARKKLKNQQYARQFYNAVLAFLRFDSRHALLAERMARAVTDLATPVGSGTVARTERIPLQERVSRAVIAWMRHQTTAYDHMTIARVKGRRRQVRRELAAESIAILQRYRDGGAIPPSCPLLKALNGKENILY